MPNYQPTTADKQAAYAAVDMIGNDLSNVAESLAVGIADSLLSNEQAVKSVATPIKRKVQQQVAANAKRLQPVFDAINERVSNAVAENAILANTVAQSAGLSVQPVSGIPGSPQAGGTAEPSNLPASIVPPVAAVTQPTIPPAPLTQDIRPTGDCFPKTQFETCPAGYHGDESNVECCPDIVYRKIEESGCHPCDPATDLLCPDLQSCNFPDAFPPFMGYEIPLDILEWQIVVTCPPPADPRWEIVQLGPNNYQVTACGVPYAECRAMAEKYGCIDFNWARPAPKPCKPCDPSKSDCKTNGGPICPDPTNPLCDKLPPPPPECPPPCVTCPALPPIPPCPPPLIKNELSCPPPTIENKVVVNVVTDKGPPPPEPQTPTACLPRAGFDDDAGPFYFQPCYRQVRSKWASWIGVGDLGEAEPLAPAIIDRRMYPTFTIEQHITIS
jgi:hypothetical protein